MKIAVATLPPWWLAGIRFACAGIIMWLWCRARGIPLPTAREWRGAALTGVILLVGGNAGFAWTLQYIPSGTGALVFALAPLWMMLFAFLFYGERLSWIAALGLLLGLGGMVYLYSPSGAQHLPAVPTAIALCASLVWGLGSIVQRRMRSSDVLQTSAMQALVAACVLIVFARVSGTPLERADFTPATLGALAYLVVFGSVIGFSAYLWLMNNVRTALAATYSYVNPLVSLAIGIGFLREPFSWRLALGAGIILAGVAVLMLAPRPLVTSPALPPISRAS